MRILALDHGSARCGCAVCDPTETIVRPLAAIAKPDSGPGQEALTSLVETESIELVLIGLPRLPSGEEGTQAAAARSFAGRLGAKIRANRPELPVELYDERFTTRMAQASIHEGASASEDSLAAAHLLEEFIAQRRKANPNEQ
jgi:putative Holliday junction resolvase